MEFPWRLFGTFLYYEAKGRQIVDGKEKNPILCRPLNESPCFLALNIISAKCFLLANSQDTN